MTSTVMNPLNTTRKALLTLDNGARVLVDMLIPTRLLLHSDNAEKELVKMWNKSSGMEHKVVKIHLMRN